MARTSSVYLDMTDDEISFKRKQQLKAIQADAASKSNESICPAHIKTKANELLLLVQSAYMRSRSWKNYRAKTATVKVENPCAADKMAAYRDDDLMSFCRHHNIKTTTSGKSLIFHIK